MIRVTSQWLHRAANFNLSGVGLPFTASIAAKTTLLLRRSTSHVLMKHTAEFHTPQPAINPPSEDPLDPHTYTSGRWLRHDKLERDARYIKFDFDELRKRVVELCHGASSITSYEKNEGGFNRVFIFTCDNGKRVIARLPTRVAGPCGVLRLTLIFVPVQSSTTVPIPTILDWSDDSLNAIGSEYIIMEHAVGVQLHQKWPTMSGVQKIACIEAISRNIQQIAAIKFPVYGSLYFSDVPIDSASKVPLAQGFCIGAHCGTKYWACNIGEVRYYISIKPNRGPWFDLAAYCDGLIDTGLSRLPFADKCLAGSQQFSESVATHIHLLNFGRDVLHKLSEDPRIRETAAPTLCHADLHKRNIFVSDDDPTIITDLIDWQSSSIEPAFEYVDETPDFAALSPNLSLEDEHPDICAELCRRAFDACLQGLVPRLSAARALDDNLLRPFRYCHRTWRDGAVAFRQELIEISSRWKELGLSNSCPYPLPTSNDLVVHQTEFEDFVEARKLKQRLTCLLDTTPDGWVPTQLWEATKSAHKEAFDEIVKAVRDADEESMSEEKLRKIWPFDIE
ncbi:hypothetical protein MMC17_005554 [Xylographa soralifera]|nr:hypothetical protein [Xylographa soralifera]